MPYGIKDPSSYVSKITNIYERPFNNTSCCCCTRNNVAIAPVHIQSKRGLLVTFVCATCYQRFKRKPDMKFEDTEERSVPAIMNTDLESAENKKPKKKVAASCDVHKALIEMRQLAVRMLHLADVLGSSIVSPEATHDVHVPELKTVSESTKTVSEVSKTVSEVSVHVIPEESEKRGRGRPRKPIDSSQMDDEELFAGMTDEQRAKMDRAVGVAQARDGVVIEADHG